MRVEVCQLDFDHSERGAVITALENLKEKRADEGKTNEVVDSLLKRIKTAPFKKARILDAAR